MTLLRGLAASVLFLALFVATAVGADDMFVLRYDDGHSQRIKLDRPSDSIRQIEFPESRRGFGREGLIDVIAATYGGNCGAAFGNATRDLAEVCNGRGICEYVIDYRVLGDPASGCAKDYVAEWRCGRDPKTQTVGVRPEAGGGTRITLKCPGR